MVQITESQEFVAHKRDDKHDTSVRKYEKVCYDKLFGGMTPEQIIFDLNKRWFTHKKTAFVFDKERPEEYFAMIQDLLALSKYTCEFFEKLEVKEDSFT